MADNKGHNIEKWVKFDNDLEKDENQGEEFNEFIEKRKNSTDHSIFTSSGNQDKYKEFYKIDQESGYKGWSIDIRGTGPMGWSSDVLGSQN